MGRRTRRRNQQAARQAGLYEEQALPIITNEMIENAFAAVSTTPRLRGPRVGLSDYDGYLQLSGVTQDYVRVSWAKTIMPASMQGAERAKAAFLKTAGRSFVVIKLGDGLKLDAGKAVDAINTTTASAVNAAREILGEKKLVPLKMYGVQGGAVLFEVLTEEATA